MVALIIVIILGLIIASIVSFRIDSDENGSSLFPLISGLMLPIASISCLIFYYFTGSREYLLSILFYFIINLSICISIYYLVLIVLLKWLRNKFNLILVSLLWTIPNYLYYFLLYNLDYVFENKIIVTINKSTIDIISGVWLTVVLFIIIYKIVEHLTYKKEILNGAYELIDKNILDIYESEKKDLTIHSRLKLMVSDKITSPLTIGIYKPILLLPNKKYTDEEYHLIFRHEIVHIIRQDSVTKFFLIFCNALCWFNPIMLFASKKCSEDIELSCDYHVLKNENDITRRKYAKLILNNVNSEKGFTTCLSANAKALQYRLKNVLAPKLNKKGSLLIAISFVLVISSFGTIGIAIDEGMTGKELFFHNESLANIELDHYSSSLGKYDVIHRVLDKEKVIERLSNLKVDRLAYEYNEMGKDYQILKYKLNDNNYHIYIYENNIFEFVEYVPKYKNTFYKVSDFEISHLIDTYPSLNVDLLNFNMSVNWIEQVQLVEVIENNQIIYQKEFVELEYVDRGYIPTEFRFIFSDENIKEYTVLIDNGEVETIHYKDIVNDTIPAKDGLYTIKTTYTKNNNIYQATYQFKF